MLLLVGTVFVIKIQILRVIKLKRVYLPLVVAMEKESAEWNMVGHDKEDSLREGRVGVARWP